MAFFHSLEGSCTDAASLAFLRRHPSTISFRKKWSVEMRKKRDGWRRRRGGGVGRDRGNKTKQETLSLLSRCARISQES
jgi:hypothetical protein